MKLQAILTLSALVSIGVAATAAHADTTYSTTTTSLDPVPSSVVETRSTTIESSPAPVMIRETQPVYVQPSREVIVVKKHHHHLINVGPVKVF